MSTEDSRDSHDADKGKNQSVENSQGNPDGSDIDERKNPPAENAQDGTGRHGADKRKGSPVENSQNSSGNPNAIEGAWKLDSAATQGFLECINNADGVYVVVNSNAPSAQGPQHKGGKKRFFGIPKGSAPANANPDDYEAKYPEDAYGEETGASARVWRTYLDEAQKADGELIDGWRDTTDVLLVFAGLFSAVVATFVVQTSTALRVDYAQVTADLLLETNSLLRAMVNQTLSGSTSSSPLDPASSFSSSTNDRWVNGLWFTSLSVSLATAFMAVLVKQWIQHYQSVVFGTAQEQVQIRQFRFLGVERWQMPLIIGTLPILLHLSLFLYFAGLIVFLIPLDGPISYTIATIAGLAYGFYFLSILLPLWYPMCPYKTPLSSLLAWSFLSLCVLVSDLAARLRGILIQIRPKSNPSFHPSTSEESAEESPKGRSGVLHRLREAEKKAVQEIADEIDAQAIVWLYSTSSNPTVMSVTIQAISGLRLDFNASAKNILKRAVTFKKDTVEYALMKRCIESGINGRSQVDLENGVLAALERLLRACHQLESKVSGWMLYQARIVLAGIERPRFQVQVKCLDLLSDVSYVREKAPAVSLERYHYASEGPQPLMWLILLKQNLRQNRHSFRTPSECWAHALRMILSSAKQDLRQPILWEYLCSLSILDSDGRCQQILPDCGWGAHSVIDGAPFCYAKVAPKIYSALSTAIDTLRDEQILPLLDDLENSLPHALWHILHSLREMAIGAKRINDDDEKQIEITASGLYTSIQTLVESAIFWENSPQRSRDRFCLHIFDRSIWPSSVFASRISWTPELMDWLLRSSIFIQPDWGRSQWSELYSYFSEGTPQIYLFFLEKGGLSTIERVRHCNEFLPHYLDGLLNWKGSTADLDRHINHLFHPNNFSHIMREYVFEHDSNGNLQVPVRICYYCWGVPFPELVKRLFKLRSPGLHPASYGPYLGPFRELQLEDLDGGASIPAPAVGDLEPQTSPIPRGWLNGGQIPLKWVRNRIRRDHNDEGKDTV